MNSVDFSDQQNNGLQRELSDFYDAYSLKCSDLASGDQMELKNLCNVYELVIEHKEIFDKYVEDFLDSLKSDIYGLYETIVTSFNSCDEYDLYDTDEEVKEFLGASTYNTCQECER